MPFRVFKTSCLLTLLFFAIFVIRQVFLSTGLIASQTELAADLISEFFSSTGAVLDLARFIFSLLFLYGLFAFLVALIALGLLPKNPDRRRIRTITLLSFLLAVLTVLVWVSVYFPVTAASFLKVSPLASTSIGTGLTALLTVFCFVGLVKLFRLKHYRFATFGCLVICSLTLVNLMPFLGAQLSSSVANAYAGEREKPNVIIIGIDALRPDHMGINGYKHDLTPNLDRFLEESLYFEQAFTPIARTYTAWFSLLSGRAPISTGIRYNLQRFEESQLTGNELQFILKNEGYHTIYGMDERRFNNIDERYGFDETIGPAIGAADFLLFHASELPLVALVSNTPMGKYLFPFIYSNRGVHGTYMPETFTREVLEAASSAPEKPLFLALHLTLPHWPFLFRDFEPLPFVEYDPENHFHYSYQLTLNKVDQQFQNIMDGLTDQGLTRNALIFVISDHGEGFMLEADALKGGVAGLEFPTEAHGHGTNVLDEEQFHILMAVKDTAAEGFEAKRIDQLTSLVDIAPTVADRLKLVEADSHFEGESLFRVASCPDCKERYVFMESSVATNAMFEEDLDMVQVLQQGIGFYKVDEDGLAIVRDEVSELLVLKQRAIITKKHIVAHFPGLDEDFLIVNRQTDTWWPSTKYGGDSPEEIVDLMKKLCAYYRNDTGFDRKNLCAGAD